MGKILKSIFKGTYNYSNALSFQQYEEIQYSTIINFPENKSWTQALFFLGFHYICENTFKKY